MTAFAGQRIWIVGTSHGIGRALAVALAAQGAHLILSARSTSELEELNSGLGGGHQVLPLDVTTPEAFTQALAQLKDGPPDTALYMAGLYAPMPIAEIDLPAATQMVAVNLTGAIAFASVLFAAMRSRGTGRLVLCGSIAGYTGLPGGQPYSATKAGVNNLAESLAAEAAGSGVVVQLICPGFVDTRMTRQNRFAMPALLSAEQAATAICTGLKGRAFEIHFPKRLTLAAKLLRLLPYSLALPYLRRL